MSKLNFNKAITLMRYGLTHRARGDFDLNLAYQKRAVELANDVWEIRLNYGVALQDNGDLSAAIREFQISCEISKNNPIARTNLGIAQIRRKPSLEAFQNYLYRWDAPGWTQKIYQLPFPKWAGESLSQKKIVIVLEQGYGDSIFILPVIRNLIEKYPGQIYVVTNQALHALYQQALLGCKYLGLGNSIKEKVDYWTTGFDIFAYYVDSIDDYEFNRAQISKNYTDNIANNLTVGLVWRGNKSYAYDKWRSITLAEMLNRVGNISSDVNELWLGQIDLSEEEIDLINRKNIPWQSAVGNFHDSAVTLSQIKSIYTTDTAVAHLSGLLGIDTKLILGPLDGLYWSKSNASFWYPNIRVI